MLFEIEDIPIYFPYDYIYPEQITYIKSLLVSIRKPGHILIEMPSGAGKTISLLSCTVSYFIYCKKHNKEYKIVYCSRTLQEIEKVLKELKSLIAYIEKYIKFDFLAFGLSKRENLCINPVALSGNTEFLCRKMIKNLEGLNCDFYDKRAFDIPKGVYSFTDIKELGKQKGFCPYYAIRETILQCNCIVFSYNYLVDPSIYSIITEKFQNDCFVIFDEAHNIDSNCIESLSIDITRRTLESSTHVLKKLETLIQSHKLLAKDNLLKKQKLKEITSEGIPYYFYKYSSKESNDPIPKNPIEEDIYEFTPGNLRHSNHFISIVKRFLEFLKTKLKSTHLTTETPSSFLKTLEDLTCVDKKALRFCSQRLSVLASNLNFEDAEFYQLKAVMKFASLLSMYSKGFSVIFEPFDSLVHVFNPTLRLYCMDASIAMSHVFKKFRNVIITSGTLSPIEMYPVVLNFTPSAVFEIGVTLEKNQISPVIISKGDDQVVLENNEHGGNYLLDFLEDKTIEVKNKITTSFKIRIDASIVRNYGIFLLNVSKTVPDNVVVFFPSYIYMEQIITLWNETGFIDEFLRHKLIFIETPNNTETDIALKKFKIACDNGRGAMLFSVARGKVSEGVDFKDGYGRAVVVLGVPFMYTESVRLKERLKYLKKEFGILEYDFLVFDAMRHTAQCLGRVLRGKDDYGIMLLADSRFTQESKLSKLPKWIQQRIEKGNVGLSIEMAMNVTKYFFKEMAQKSNSFETSLVEEKNVKNFLKK